MQVTKCLFRQLVIETVRMVRSSKMIPLRCFRPLDRCKSHNSSQSSVIIRARPTNRQLICKAVSLKEILLNSLKWPCWHLSISGLRIKLIETLKSRWNRSQQFSNVPKHLANRLQRKDYQRDWIKTESVERKE